MGHSVECGKYLVERVLYPEEQQQLETEDVYIASITPAQTSRIIQFTNKVLPKLDGIEHVKRVNRTDSGMFFVLSQCRLLDRGQLDALIQDTEWKMLDIAVGKIPKTPPYTREQYEQWKQIWPVTFRPPLKLKRIEFGSDEKAYIETCLQMAEKLKDESADTGNRPVAAIIGNSRQHRIIAQAADTTSESKNPLNHAVMNCIARVAEMEVARLADSLEVPTKRSHGQSENELVENEEHDTAGYLCEGLDWD
ncbi:tRNA-specific adenosine deaminase subunit tad3 [Coemansia brasiliensis]|uniref:tRNA-specific adenosine deaminase subunit tad3 n=1 Tax=Coemansia brasiliensis TaxID=2650707 RepID=A0A9W8I8A1_9FUNG|nr:tRNA-specific adenosine deaminase subunit tad3 [Coemansia brasiliensis]